MTGTSSSDRPAIPKEIKRQVRQRCGFGCVVCGLPLYEYDHMDGWAATQQHTSLTLLCSNHHSEKDKGMLPIEKVREFDANPFNRNLGSSSPYPLHYSGAEFKAMVGSNLFHAPGRSFMIPIAIDDVPILQFRVEDCNLLLSLSAFDANNNLVLRIIDNELIYSTRPWDIEFRGQRLVIREAPRRYLLDARLEPPNGVRIDRGRILCNGVELRISPHYIVLVNKGIVLSHCDGEGDIGLQVGRHDIPLGSAIEMPDVPRYEYDRDGVLKSAAQFLKLAHPRSARR